MNYCSPNTLMALQLGGTVVLALTAALAYTVPVFERWLSSARKSGGGALLITIPAASLMMGAMVAWVVGCA